SRRQFSDGLRVLALAHVLAVQPPLASAVGLLDRRTVLAVPPALNPPLARAVVGRGRAVRRRDAAYAPSLPMAHAMKISAPRKLPCFRGLPMFGHGARS